MCGFVGILDPSNSVDLACAAKATREALARRGPDGSGAVVDHELRCALEHHRLAIFDLESDGRQPMSSRSGRFTLVFNGSIFDHADQRRVLERQGAVFRTRTDTEVLLEAFDTWGIEETLHRVDGMFAIGVLDRRERRLVLARDRAGQKPLLIARSRGALAFASDLQALEMLPSPFAERLGDIDETSLEWFLRLGVVPWPRSIRPGVEHLEPGGMASIDLKTLHATRSTWWSPIASARSDVASEPTESSETLDVLRESVHRQCRSDRPVGVMLSGGLDSRLVAALASEVLDDLPCFTLAMPGAFDESGAAAHVARQIGAVHHVVRPTAADVLDEVQRLPAIASEPFADSSLIPTTILARAARERIVVALGGDGGDELFGGYRRHVALWRAMRHPRWSEATLARMLGALPDTLTGRLPVGRQTLRDLVRRRACIGPDGVDLLALRSLQGDAVDLLDGSDDLAPLSFDRGGRRRAKDMAPPWDGVVGPVSDPRALMRADFRQYLPDDPLVKVDVGGMSVALEYRAPLLGRDVVAHAFSLSESELFDRHGGRAPIRRALRDRGLQDRSAKRGFAAPLGRWLRGPLRAYAGDLLAWEAPDPLSRARLQTLWNEFLGGRTDRATAIWTVVSWRSWLRRRG